MRPGIEQYVTPVCVGSWDRYIVGGGEIVPDKKNKKTILTWCILQYARQWAAAEHGSKPVLTF